MGIPNEKLKKLLIISIDISSDRIHALFIVSIFIGDYQMNPITKLKIYGETYFAQKSDIPLQDLIDVKSKTLAINAPDGKSSFYLTVQPDGSSVTSEIVRPDDEIIDELALRKKMGEIYANTLQRKATRTIEDASRYDFNIRDTHESLQENREKQSKLLDNTHDYYFAESEARKNMLIFLAVALGDIGAMFTLFADFFGLDPMRLGREFMRHPVSVMTTAFFTVGFFAASLLIAEQVLKSSRRVLWVVVLIFMAFLTAKFRTVQSASLGEIEINPIFLTTMYTTIGIVFPLAAAVFAERWRESKEITGLADSMSAQLKKEETILNERLQELEQQRKAAHEGLDTLTEEYVSHFQNAQGNREKSNREWERHRRLLESYLAEVRLAYLFWQGWERKREIIIRPIKKSLEITSAIIIVLATSLLSVQTASADTKFNVLALCDRSSSAGDYSCTSETIESLFRYWIRKVDNANGGTFELFLIDQGFDTSKLLFYAEYPDHFPGPVSAHKKKWRIDFMEMLSQKMKDLPRNTGSAVVEAIFRTSLRIPPEGETLLSIQSDMRQMNDAFNFEKRVPSEKEFLNWLNKQAMTPKFKDSTSLTVCGVHPYTPSNTSRMTTQNYEQLIRLWQEVFKHWGVKASFSEACEFNIQE